MNLLRDLPPRDGNGCVHVVVEVPRGSGVKLKYDETLGLFTWSRSLSLGMRFPYDFGFVPQTLAEDGDGVDVVVYAETGGGTPPGALVSARLIGALRVEQKRDGQPIKRNDRLIAIPAAEHRLAHLVDVSDLPRRVCHELEAFFAASLALTGKHIEFRGWADAVEAAQLLDDAVARFGATPDAA